jgi:hypothetical protein
MEFVHSLESPEWTCTALHVTENSRLAGAYFHARREQTFCDPVIAKRTLIGSFPLWVKIAGSVGTRLDTIPAPDASFIVNENHPILGLECCPNGADLNTRRIVTLIAQFGYKKASEDVSLSEHFVRPFDSHIGVLNGRFSIFLDHISLDPRAEEKWFLGDVVFFFARLHTFSAANAFVDLDSHSIVMALRIVPVCAGNRTFEKPTDDCRRGSDRHKLGQKSSSLHAIAPPACVDSGTANTSTSHRE